MKKIIIIVLSIFILTGCGSKSEFEEAMDNMDSIKAVSVLMEINDVPIFGTITGEVVVEGNKTKTTMFGEVIYTFTEDGNEYYLRDFKELLYKAPLIDDEGEELDGNFLSAIDEFSSFLEEDFTLEDGYYVTEENIEDMLELAIMIKDGYVSEMIFKVDSDGYIFEIILEFSEIGTATVDLPEYVEPNELEEKILLFMSNDYEYEELFNGFLLDGYSIDVTLHKVEGYFEIMDWLDRTNYYPETKTIVVIDRMKAYTYTFEEYFDGTIDTVFTVEEFEALDEIYSLLD